MQAEQQEESRQMRKMQKNAERYVSRRNLLLRKKEDCTKNIRELGVLPEEAFEKYKNTTSEKVCTLRVLLLFSFFYTCSFQCVA
jgi:structural maintenance of chromosome 3 (chondroitin sulfate proteoglycan 6)